MQRKYKILIFTIIIGVLIMSAIIIPSKHIYGEPTYNTSNNIISGAEWEENQNSYANESIFSQEYIVTEKETTVEEDGTSKDEFIYTFDEYTSNNLYTERQYVKNQDIIRSVGYFIFNTDKIIDKNKILNLDINFVLDVEQLLPSAIGKFEQSKTKMSGTYIQSIDFDDFKEKTKSELNEVFYYYEYLEEKQIKFYFSFRDTAFFVYLMNITFNINSNLLNVEKSTKQIGTKTTLSLESNELMANSTKYYSLPYNELTYENNLGLGIRTISVSSAFPTTSDVSVRISYYSALEDPKYTTLVIPKGSTKSNVISVSLIQTFGSIREISPKYDDNYAYDYDYWYNTIGKKIGQYISEDIISNYKNGKKRINIQVGYGDYYYDDGTPYGGIAGAKKLLQVGDVVQPMQWKNEKDVPFAINKDGSPMIFEITSAELDTSGAPKLFLQLLQKTT